MTDGSLTALVGAAIRARRLDLRMGQADLARRAGASVTATNGVERRPRANISIDMLERYAAALGCRVSDLIADAESLRFMIAAISTRRLPRDESDPPAAYGRALRTLRKRAGLRLVDVCERSGLTPPQLCEAERSERPSLRLMERAAVGLGVSLSEIVALAETLMVTSAVDEAAE